MYPSGVIEFRYTGTRLTRAGIADAALADWREFLNDETVEDLPWNTSILVRSIEAETVSEGYTTTTVAVLTRYEALVTVRWERSSPE
jgi:hypothetical protein